MDFNECLQKFDEYGVVEEVRHPIVTVSGLPGVRSLEVVVFETGERGQVISLNQSSVTILVLNNNSIRVGSQVARTGEALTVKVGTGLLGSVVDSLGDVLVSAGDTPSLTEQRLLETSPLSITYRTRVKKPLLTGVSLVDLLMPLGKGQRELVAGDKLTGKSAFLLTILKNQALADMVVVYAAIGKPAREVKSIYNFAQDSGALKNTIVVFGSPSDSPSLLYFTPYTAMAIAEYFRDQGRDVLVFFDDLSTHARFYREISLLARKFPGRDSYPGDIFYVHARLLERGGSFKTGSITCLPVAETTDSDLTDYIVSNLVGITDGHLLFDATAFIKDRRPAINPLLSVTRVGRQTQSVLHQDVSRTLTSFLVEYEKSQSFSYFGEELTDAARTTLSRGEKLIAFFNQPIELVMPLPVQLTLIGMIWSDILSRDSGARIHAYRQRLIDAYVSDQEVNNTLSSITEAVSFNEMLIRINQNRELLEKTCKIQRI